TSIENQDNCTYLATIKTEIDELITDALGDDELEEKQDIPKLVSKPPLDASPTLSPAKLSIPVKTERRSQRIQVKRTSVASASSTLSPAKVKIRGSQRRQCSSVVKCSKIVDKIKADCEILEFYKRLVCHRCEPQQIARENPVIEYNTLVELNRHYREEHRTKQATIRCPVCSTKCRTRTDLLVHKDMHIKPDKRRCMKCLEVHQNLDQHKKTRHDEKHHSCTKCGKVYGSQSQLALHMQNFHKTDRLSARKAKASERMSTVDHEILEFYKRLVCERCDPQRAEPWIEYNNLSELNRHSRREHKKRRAPVKCPLCSNHYAARTDLLKHKDVHLNPDNHRCKECLEVHQNMDVHVKTKHSEKLYSCTECDNKFAFLGKLTRHMRIRHTPRDVRCGQCNRLFSKYTIETHKKAAHGVGYICEFCPTRFKCRYKLLRHVEHHKGTNSKLRPVACSKCNTVLKDIYQLKAHNRLVHGDQSRVICKSCGKSFKKMSLYKHMKEICTEPNLECKICGKLFKQVKNLQEHLTTHTGMPLYVCNFCPETFKFQSHFYTHRKTAHPKEWLEIREKKKEGIQHKIQHLRNVIHNPDIEIHLP
ncbi:zinc finger protein 431-like, partial [Anopheles coustani]|uniref:zinc finger protein 431-like n=1 Tax=Anopheles coustani TaxID=139045 RepID=UPI00265AA79A